MPYRGWLYCSGGWGASATSRVISGCRHQNTSQLKTSGLQQEGVLHPLCHSDCAAALDPWGVRSVISTGLVQGECGRGEGEQRRGKAGERRREGGERVSEGRGGLKEEGEQGERGVRAMWLQERGG